MNKTQQKKKKPHKNPTKTPQKQNKKPPKTQPTKTHKKEESLNLYQIQIPYSSNPRKEDEIDRTVQEFVHSPSTVSLHFLLHTIVFQLEMLCIRNAVQVNKWL